MLPGWFSSLAGVNLIVIYNSEIRADTIISVDNDKQWQIDFLPLTQIAKSSLLCSNKSLTGTMAGRYHK